MPIQEDYVTARLRVTLRVAEVQKVKEMSD
jgi:hypothetical protein